MAAPFRGFLTSHNGSSVNFLGDGTIFWGDGTARSAKVHNIGSLRLCKATFFRKTLRDGTRRTVQRKKARTALRA